MQLTCTNNHPGITLPDGANIPQGLACGTCGLPMMPTKLMKPFMTLQQWNEQIFPALSVASDRAEQEAEEAANKGRKPGDITKRGMGNAMMKIMGTMHHVMMVEQLKKLIVIPEEIAALDHDTTVV